MPYVILSTAIPPARMGVYMGVFNLFIVIPQVVMSFLVPPIFDSVLGGDPVNVVALGGVSMLIAAATVFVVHDVSGRVPIEAVLDGDERELLTVQTSAQPVPSTGLIDDTSRKS
jgi:maltose/moltooligosaccharide transporter